MSEKEIIELCRELGIHFVNRSYGKATQSTITFDAIKKLVKKAEDKALNPELPNLPPNW